MYHRDATFFASGTKCLSPGGSLYTVLEAESVLWVECDEFPTNLTHFSVFQILLLGAVMSKRFASIFNEIRENHVVGTLVMLYGLLNDPEFIRHDDLFAFVLDSRAIRSLSRCLHEEVPALLFAFF